jgi:ubiquitin carboxyl-terminal hydrolase 36/42
LHRCKKAVIAEKQFTVHDAPLVLTVHLKRFTPMGRKIGHHVKYDDRISLQQVMSEGQFGPSYVLYGVICHAGGGPNSGHYYAHVKAGDGRWYEMNDEVVTPSRGPPVGLKSAYVLFYIRDKGQALQAAVTTTSNHPPLLQRSGVAAGMKKRRTSPGDGEEGEEDLGVKATPEFIGPLLPASATTSTQASIERPISIFSDPQADLVKKRIEAAKNRGSALSAISQYRGESEEESGRDSPDVKGTKPSVGLSRENSVQSSSPQLPPTSPPLPSSPPIPPATFYGTSSKRHLQINLKKRKSPDGERDENFKSHVRTPLPVFSPQRSNGGGTRRSGYGDNPFSRLSGSNNIKTVRTYGHRKKSYAV